MEVISSPTNASLSIESPETASNIVPIKKSLSFFPKSKSSPTKSSSTTTTTTSHKKASLLPPRGNNKQKTTEDVAGNGNHTVRTCNSTSSHFTINGPENTMTTTPSPGPLLPSPSRCSTTSSKGKESLLSKLSFGGRAVPQVLRKSSTQTPKEVTQTAASDVIIATDSNDANGNKNESIITVDSTIQLSICPSGLELPIEATLSPKLSTVTTIPKEDAPVPPAATTPKSENDADMPEEQEVPVDEAVTATATDEEPKATPTPPETEEMETEEPAAIVTVATSTSKMDADLANKTFEAAEEATTIATKVSSMSSSSSIAFANTQDQQDDQQESLWWGLILPKVLNKIGHPSNCISRCYNSMDDVIFAEESLETVIETIKKDILTGGKSRTNALRELYTLTDRQHSYNRVPIVCTAKWDIIRLLISCISVVDVSDGESIIKNSNDEDDDKIDADNNSDGSNNSNGDNTKTNVPAYDRRQACLILGNLSIPTENKAVMILGKDKDILLDTLLHIIRNNCLESYLCAVILMNLSYLNEAKNVLIQYIPKNYIDADGNTIATASTTNENEESSPSSSPTDPNNDDDDNATEEKKTANANDYTQSIENECFLNHPYGLLRTIESMMKRNSKLVKKCEEKKIKSVEVEAVRYSIGMIRNLTARNYHNDEKQSKLTKSHTVDSSSPDSQNSINNTTATTTTKQKNDNDADVINVIKHVGKTDIPRLILTVLHDTTKPIEEWTQGSLEDLCLLSLINLVHYREYVPILNVQKQIQQEETTETNSIVRKSLQNVIGQGGIHDMRASAILFTVEHGHEQLQSHQEEK